ncbi:MAG: CDP-glycerol glycerophosphotransferase family protein [Dehalococcoidia bacterium]
MLREIADFYRFFWRTGRADKTIVFYAEHEGYYPCFEGIIERLTGEHGQTICYVTSDPHDPILQRADSHVNTFYIRRLLPFFMALVNCRVFVMTLTDLNQFHLKRSAGPVHYVYVFHSLVSTHMSYRYGAFDHYDSVLCCGSYQAEEIRRHEEHDGLPAKQLVETGYYRLERICEAYRRYSSETPSSAAGKTVLIAPSWGDDNVLESCGERLVRLLLEAGYEVIVRPHPETVRRSPDLIALFASSFGDDPHFTLELSVATDDSLLRSDVLICDCSGVYLEYAFGTERPVLFLDVPVKVKNHRFEELGITPLELSLRNEVGVIVPLEKLHTVPQVVSDLSAGGAAYKSRLAELRKQYVYPLGQSSDISARHILSVAAGNDLPDRTG